MSWYTPERPLMTRCISSCESISTEATNKLLTYVSNANITCCVISIIELLFAPSANHLLLNTCIIVVSSISIIFAILSTVASNEFKSFDPIVI